MARILSQTLIRESQALIHDPPSSSSSSRYTFFASRFISLRGRSKLPERAQLQEINLGADESGSGHEAEILGMRKLQEAIQAIMIRRAAPDWLPFVPGSSYWIPPARNASPMTEEEKLSLSSVNGWPSFSYFVEGVLPCKVDNSPEKATHSQGKANPKSSSKSDDEESGLQSIDKINGPASL